MTDSVVVAVQDPATAQVLEDLLAGEASVSVRAVAGSAEALLAAVLDHEPDVVLLHEGFGPAPALSIARDLVARLPWVSVVLLTREPTLALHAVAADAGVRSLAAVPPSLSELTARIGGAARWSRNIRNGSEARSSHQGLGTVLAVAGSKGGVGATTIATQLAFLASSDRTRRICLVDLDLYGGTLADYLGATAVRTVAELADVSDELGPGVVQPVLYAHESGVRVLFAPDDAADCELVTASLVRRVVAVLRTMFDVVVVDVGSHVVEAALPAVELADRVVLLVTPDLLSVRAAHRLAENWERLDVRRRDAVELVVNRVSPRCAVQPRLIGQTSAMPVCRAGIPAAFGALESLANEGARGLRQYKPLARPLHALALHLGVVPPPPARFAPLWRRRRRTGDEAPEGAPATAVGVHGRSGPERAVPEAGSVTLEAVSVGLVLVLGMLLCAQLLLLARSAAALALVTPAAARDVATGQSPEQVEARLRQELPWAADGLQVTRRGSRVVVTLPLAVAAPGVDGPVLLRSDAGVRLPGGSPAEPGEVAP